MPLPSKPLPSIERLRDLVSYDLETGVFTWLRSRGGKAIAGSRAGNVRDNGYRKIWIDGGHYFEHRLAFKMVTGRDPDEHRLAFKMVTGRDPAPILDHINRDPLDNRFCNLREATQGQNIANSRTHRDSLTGFKGVTRHKAGKWDARIYVDGKCHWLGRHETPEAAHDAYCLAAARHRGEFSRAA